MTEEQKVERKKPTWLRVITIISIIIFLPVVLLVLLWKFLKRCKLRCWVIICILMSTLSIMTWEFIQGRANTEDLAFGIDGFPLWVLFIIFVAFFIATCATLTVCIMRSTFRKV